MGVANHDTLVRRLALILVKLNQGEKLDPQNLALEFGVNLRTIQRDINERFSYLPLEKIQGSYFLPPAFLGRLTLKDVDRFASLAGVKGLFPSLSEDFLREIFGARIQSTLLVKGKHAANPS
jgi:predicted DNA-binding transcriptional regulator YafY